MSAQTATIIGGPVSPYVRKVLAVCEMKGVPYRLDPIVPFFGDDLFSELSPLRRIPVFIDDKVSLCDSTVICEYLEDRYPTPRILPADYALRAQARWLEEFADTRMGDVFIWRVFYEAVILPFIFQKPRDKEKIAKAVTELLPGVMDYLETIAPSGGFLAAEVSMGDIAVAIPFSNLRWARVRARQGSLAEGLRLGRPNARHARACEGDKVRRQADADGAGTPSRGARRDRGAAYRDDGCKRHGPARAHVGLGWFCDHASVHQAPAGAEAWSPTDGRGR